jgi:hypothetical protein
MNVANLVNTIGRIAKARQALRGPAALASQILSRMRRGGVVFRSDEEFFRRLVGGRPMRSFDDYRAELLGNEEMKRRFEFVKAKYGLAKYASWEDRIARVGHMVAIYGLVRERCPELIVETGTAAGSLTSFMLAALDRNNRGELVSIDIPAVAGKLTMDIGVPADEAGYHIADAFRGRWKYVVGDAKLVLPGLLAERSCQIFVHDSLHTRTHMAFEYAVARALLAPDTLILSDDIGWNNAFFDFCAMNQIVAFAPFSNPNFGGFVNRFDAFESSTGLGIWRGDKDSGGNAAMDGAT